MSRYEGHRHRNFDEEMGDLEGAVTGDNDWSRYRVLRRIVEQG